jgi:hypothetical protein
VKTAFIQKNVDTSSVVITSYSKQGSVKTPTYEGSLELKLERAGDSADYAVAPLLNPAIAPARECTLLLRKRRGYALSKWCSTSTTSSFD